MNVTWCKNCGAALGQCRCGNFEVFDRYGWCLILGLGPVALAYLIGGIYVALGGRL